MKDAGIEGTVEIKLTIHKNGSAHTHSVIEGDGRIREEISKRFNSKEEAIIQTAKVLLSVLGIADGISINLRVKKKKGVRTPPPC